MPSAHRVILKGAAPAAPFFLAGYGKSAFRLSCYLHLPPHLLQGVPPYFGSSEAFISMQFLVHVETAEQDGQWYFRVFVLKIIVPVG
jgi:hypothetical protein